MVYARVSKTRGCNDLESSSLSPGTLMGFDGVAIGRMRGLK